MAQPRQRVNQKLSYAHWHLRWMDTLADSDQQQGALLESAVMHTLGAYRAFLLEVSRDEHLSPDAPRVDVDTATHLSGAYSEFLPPALAECVILEGKQGWLSDLLRWGDEVSAGEGVRRSPRPGLIARSAGDGELSPALMVECLAQLEALIDRMRGGMLEY